MSKGASNEDDVLKAAIGLSCAAIVLTALPAALYCWSMWSRPTSYRFKAFRNGIAPALLFMITAIIWIALLDKHPLYRPEFLNDHHWVLFALRVVSSWSVFSCLSLFALPLVIALLRSPSSGVRAKDFKNLKSVDWSELRDAFCDPKHFPIGVNVKSGDVMMLSQDRRCSHVVTYGATGTGKTVLITNGVLHAIKHNQPCVFIDAKGDDSTLEMIIEYGRKLNSNFDERFKLVSLSHPEKSCSYNPLKHGNANQLKDRIMEALNWSEQYYQSMSASFLTTFTACIEHLGITLTLDELCKVLESKDEQNGLLKQLKKKFEDGDNHSLELFNRMSLFFEKTKSDVLSGLSAQIAILNNPTYGHLLSFKESQNELDLRSIRKQAGIAYFQLDTLSNGETSRRLGRMIIEDLKSLASEVYRNEPIEKNREFFPMFFDEFGSFAAKEFIEFVKQSRAARFAVHLYCQGLEDLDEVGPEFRRQVMSNPLTKIALRLDDSESVNEFASTAGTFDTLERSYQVEGSVIATKTGMGNMRESKQMQIEHDAIKNLNRGEAIIIEKSPSAIRGVRIYHPKEIV